MLTSFGTQVVASALYFTYYCTVQSPYAFLVTSWIAVAVVYVNFLAYVTSNLNVLLHLFYINYKRFVLKSILYQLYNHICIMTFNVFLKHLVCFNYSVYLGCGENIFLTTASSVFELFEFCFLQNLFYLDHMRRMFITSRPFHVYILNKLVSQKRQGHLIDHYLFQEVSLKYVKKIYYLHYIYRFQKN